MQVRMEIDGPETGSFRARWTPPRWLNGLQISSAGRSMQMRRRLSDYDHPKWAANVQFTPVGLQRST